MAPPLAAAVRLALLSVGLASAAFATPRWFEKNMLPARQARDAMTELTARPTFVVVDANNVRGAVNFRLSKQRLTRLIELWAAQHGLQNRIAICWDHGLVQQSVLRNGVCHAYIRILYGAARSYLRQCRTVVL